jgi:hypothetical protein
MAAGYAVQVRHFVIVLKTESQMHVVEGRVRFAHFAANRKAIEDALGALKFTVGTGTASLSELQITNRIENYSPFLKDGGLSCREISER